MPELKKCRTCGVEIQSNAPFGHCPQCLLAMGFGPIPKGTLEPTDDLPARSAIGNAQSAIGTVRYFGDYELLEQIGRGGMGVVFKARQISLRRLVALKMISAGELASPTTVQRFQFEAEAAAKLDHPNIVPIYEIGAHQGQHYFSMKLVEGENLEERIARRKIGRGEDGKGSRVGAELDSSSPVSGTQAEHRFRRGDTVRQAAVLLAQIARAVHYAHQRGVLHRDLKPSNILLDAKGQPHLTDFGLAKILEHEFGVTRTAEVMGTPSYMSPEQAVGRQLTTATDIWSLGAVLYELLAGQPPFRAENTPALLRKIAEEDPSPPGQLLRSSRRGEVQFEFEQRRTEPSAKASKRLQAQAATPSPGGESQGEGRRFDQSPLTSAARRSEKIDRDLETICLKCLEKDTSHRYASAAALADDLEHWLRDEPILARRATFFERVTKWTRRQPVLAAFVIALHVVFAIGLAGVLWQWHQAVAARRAEVAERQRAIIAEADALARLHEAKFNYVRANRLTGRPGQRFDSLAELARAATRTNSLDLRNEAIACLALPDLRPLRQWAKTPRWDSFHFNASLRSYATNDALGNLTIRDTETDMVLAQIPVRGAKAVTSFTVFSPDDRWVATADQAGQARLWEWPPRTPRLLDLPHDARLLTFTPDSRSLVVKDADGSLHFLNTTNGADERSFPSPQDLTWVQFDPSGDKFLTIIEKKIIVRRAVDGGHLRTLTTPEGAMDGFWTAVWHPDGRRVVGSSVNRIGLWDIGTGDQLAIFDGHEGPVVDLAFTRTGEHLVSASWDGTTRLWHTDTHREVLRMSESGNALSVSQDGDQLSFQPYERRQVKLYQVVEPSAGHRTALPQPTRHRVHHTGQGVFSPEGELVLAPDHDGIYIFHPPRSAPVALVPVENTYSVCLAPDGSALYTGGANGAQRWPMRESADRAELHVGPPELLEPTRGLPIDGVELSRDGQWLVGRAKHIVLTLRTTPPFEAARFDKALRFSSSPQVSPDGRWVATITPSRDRVQIWNGRTGKVLTNLPTQEAWQAAFSPNGRWLACSQKDSTTILKTADWSLRQRIAHPPREFRHGLAFSPDGRVLATFDSDRGIRLLGIETGEELAAFPAGRSTTSVCFSSAGDRLAVAHESGYFDVWDLRRLREQLAPLNLDWAMPPYPPVSPALTNRLTRVIIHTNTSSILETVDER